MANVLLSLFATEQYLSFKKVEERFDNRPSTFSFPANIHL
ncbi:hypothetical protein JOC33_003637 [Thalassobacillus pellis]|nr:hypothetical protein [Thalassobacillus pellis]